MVIQIIDIDGVAALKTEDYSPVCPYSDSPKTSQLLGKRVQPESRDVHIRNRTCCIQTGKDIAQFLHVLRQYAARIIVLIKTLQSLVAK